MEWYRFSIDTLWENGTIRDAVFSELPDGTAPDVNCGEFGLRDLGSGMFDYPTMGVWAGYVFAESKSHAREIVQRRI